MRGRSLALAALLVVTLSAGITGGISSAWAAEPVPGGACSTSNLIVTTGGPETTGVRRIMRCNGSTWQQEQTIDATGKTGVGTDSPAAPLHVNGEAIVGNTGLGCAAGIVGGIRYNSSINGMEFCNGTSWLAFNVATPVVNLVLTPASSNAMNVDGSCGSGTCYSSNVTFTLQNQGTTTSATIADSLTNTTNFEFVSDTCTGITLAANQQCTIVVRAKNTGNGSYTGNLQITANNSPFSVLSGSATNFGCVVGRVAPGGIYAACGLGGNTYDLVVTPGGCTNTVTNPTCAGGSDTTSVTADYFVAWPYSICFGWTCATNSTASGAQNSVDSLSFPSANPTISWCDQLVYGGQSDWYLPSQGEIQSYIYPSVATIGGFVNADYWTSTVYENGGNGTNPGSLSVNPTTSTVTYPPQYSGSSVAAKKIRCARRDRLGLPTAQSFSVPNYASSNPASGPVGQISSLSSTVGTASTVVSSSAFWITGINTGIVATISGSGSPQFQINGAGLWRTTAVINVGDQIVLRATTPAGGGANSVTFTAGGASLTWSAASINPTPGYFVLTSTTWDGNLGGFAGANSKCVTELTTTYTSWLGYSSASSAGLLNSSHIKAWICATSGTCNNLLPFVTYKFARADSGAVGGATFTTDANGLGPSDSNSWSGGTYFNTSTSYWTNRGSGTNTLWPSGAFAWGNNNDCTDFVSNVSSQSSVVGNPGYTTANRWAASSSLCNVSLPLVCAVNP